MKTGALWWAARIYAHCDGCWHPALHLWLHVGIRRFLTLPGAPWLAPGPLDPAPPAGRFAAAEVFREEEPAKTSRTRPF
eukprot:3582424-Pyramimonas_sp.AAC.1